MTQHSSTVRKLAFPPPPHLPRGPWVSESGEGSGGGPSGEGKRQHSLAGERAEWSCLQVRFSPSQRRALPSSPSLMESFQCHDWLLQQPKWRVASGSAYTWSPTKRDFRDFLVFPSAHFSCELVWLPSNCFTCMKAENPRSLLYRQHLKKCPVQCMCMEMCRMTKAFLNIQKMRVSKVWGHKEKNAARLNQ